MKATEILSEMPYLHHGEMPRIILDGGISPDAIARDYSQVGSVDDLPIYKDHYDTHVVVVDPGQQVDNGRLLQVFRLHFKKSHQLLFPNNFQRILQVNKVAIDRTQGSRGIASNIYKLLASLGYTIVSDDTQFEPAQSLWKRIAADPGVKVYVADVEHGLFKDDDGSPILYNGANIPDQDIWTSGSEYNGQYRVLILTK